MNSQDNNQQQFGSENQIINLEDPLAANEESSNFLGNGEAELTSKDIVNVFSESVIGSIGIKKEFSLTEDILSSSNKPEIPKRKPIEQKTLMEETQKSLKEHNCQKCDWKFSKLTHLKRHIERSKKLEW